MRSFSAFLIPLASALLLGACGGNVDGTGGGNMGGGGTGGTGGGAATGCAGLGCPSCDGDTGNTQICIAAGKTCSTSADCAATVAITCPPNGDPSCQTTPTGVCSTNLGTFTEDLLSPQCLSGLCAYQVVTAGCEDATSCDQCTAQGKSQQCAFKATAADCATCCETYYAGSDYAPAYTACACGATGPCATDCAQSPLCGGAGPETDACAACLAKSLREGGACVKSADFQDKCIHETDGSVFCKKMAQCLATCPGT